MRLPEVDPDPFASLPAPGDAQPGDAQPGDAQPGEPQPDPFAGGRPPSEVAAQERLHPGGREGIPPGARCGVEHGQEEREHPAAALCGRCGTFACEEAIAEEDGAQVTCVRCLPKSPPFPWEKRKELGLPAAFARTFWGSLFAPGDLFSRRFREPSRLPALAYGLFCATLGNLLGYGLFLLFYDPDVPVPPELLQSGMAWMLTPTGQGILTALSPLIFLFSVHLTSLLWWLGLRAAGAPRRPFGHLIRALSYLASLSLFAPLQQLPGVPGELASVLLIIGGMGLQIYAVHKVSGAELWRVILGLFIGGAMLLTLVCVLSVIVALPTLLALVH